MVARGEVWWYEHPEHGRRPFVVLTRDATIAVVEQVLAAPATRTIRGIPTEVELDESHGMPAHCALSLDNVITIRQSMCTERITRLDHERKRDVSDELANEDLHRNIRSSAASLDIILHEVARGDGYPHRVLTDPQEAERISRTIQNLDLAIVELTATLREVRGVSNRVKDGPGFAHDMIYGAGPTKPMEQRGDAAGEVALTLRGVREGDGVAHDVLYGGDGGHGRKAMEDLAAITGDLRAMVGDVRKGRGTVGALLVDPSLYEDVKLLVGNVSGNDVLRALVRYWIKQDGPRPSVQVGAAP